MNTMIHTRDFTVTPAIRHWIDRQVERALQRFEGEVTGVEIYLSDVNGPRGGDDKKVVMQTRLRGLPPVSVSTRGEDLYAAISRSAKRLRRGVKRTVTKGRRVRPRQVLGLRRQALETASQ
jgi:ribosomal subunit interface protein